MSTIKLEPDSIIRVGKIICIGQNYMRHIDELRSVRSKNPLIFMKPSTAILPEGNMIHLPDFSNEVHHEIELALLIGNTAKNISGEKWNEYISGVGVALDLTLRDLQNEAKKNGHPWTVCKGFDESCPLSTFIPLEKIKDIRALKIQLYVNDILRQDGFTGDMIWSVGELLAFISKIFTLEPGDIILTGTPEGVGKLNHGDHLRASISEIGTMRFSVK
jgi:2-keto-4-pentenoate hydratase/2-oxohepta-3-ene-1,7-dioic acid hydratase in catechol pathway